MDAGGDAGEAFDPGDEIAAMGSGLTGVAPGAGVGVAGIEATLPEMDSMLGEATGGLVRRTGPP